MNYAARWARARRLIDEQNPRYVERGFWSRLQREVLIHELALKQLDEGDDDAVELDPVRRDEVLVR